MSLVQLVEIMRDICKVWGSNSGHHKKKMNIEVVERLEY